VEAGESAEILVKWPDGTQDRATVAADNNKVIELKHSVRRTQRMNGSN
jgi:hypothetical protein